MVLCLIIPVFFATDGFGQVERIPPEDKIEQVSFRMATGSGRYSSYSWVDSHGSWHDNYAVTSNSMTSQHAKELIRELHQHGLQLRDYSGQTSSTYEITYSLKSGGHQISRRYPISASELPLLEQIFCEPEMIRSNEPVFFYQPELLEQVTLYDHIGSRIGTVSPDQYEALLEVLREDLLTMTADRLSDYSADPFCGYLSLDVKNYDESLQQNLELRDQLTKLPYGSSNLILRSSYRNTLSLLESFGLSFDQPSAPIQALVITMPRMQDLDLDPSLSLYGSLDSYPELLERTNLQWAIEDPELIQQILAASSPNRTSMSCNRLYLKMDSQQSPVRGALFIENRLLLSILKDSKLQLPYLLSPFEYCNDVYQLLNPDPYIDRPYELSSEQAMQMLFDLSENVSVAEFARRNGLDWFTGKTPEQLDAMERTALCSSNGTLIFYCSLMEY